MGRLIARLLCGLASAAAFAFAQNAHSTFDVISIRPNVSGNSNSGEHTERGRLIVTNDTVNDLIQMAFRVKGFQVIGGPGWIRSARFDIVATTGTEGDSDERFAPLVQSLLESRFGLKFHRETKESTIYSLMVAKGGPKMTVDSAEGEDSSQTNSKDGRTTMLSKKVTVDMLASRLEPQVGRRIVNNTGLTAAYDFTLTWSQDQSVDPTGPTIFTALQEELGLRLESMKGPVDMVVIDSVDRPSEN